MEIMNNFNEVVAKYPQYAEKIVNAFQAVLSNPERDMEAELSGCEIEEEDIFKLNEDIISVRFAS